MHICVGLARARFEFEAIQSLCEILKTFCLSVGLWENDHLATNTIDQDHDSISLLII